MQRLRQTGHASARASVTTGNDASGVRRQAGQIGGLGAAKGEVMMRSFMRSLSLVSVLLGACPLNAHAGTVAWAPGWDYFSEPLTKAGSGVRWTVASSGDVKVTFTLKAATPTKLYEMAVVLENTCATGAVTRFGRFATGANWNACFNATRTGVTVAGQAVPVASVVTDADGNGSASVDLGIVASGTYKVAFVALNGAGCGLIGGSCDSNTGGADFQAPGPFGSTINLVVP